MTKSEFMILQALAEEGNMRKAAERLFLTQPALSQRLQSIEKEWETPLFIRSQKGLEVTPAGEYVIAYAQETLAREKEVIEQLAALQGKVHGTLKIACASIVGQTWLPQVLKQYVAKHPEADLSIMTGWSSEMIKAVSERQAHIGIVRGQTEWKSKKIHLFRDQLYLVDQELTAIEQLAKTRRPFIQFKSDSNYHQEIQYWWKKNVGETSARQIAVDQIETCKQLVLSGIGYAILPAITLTGIETDSITKLPLRNREASFELTRDTWLIGYEAAFELEQVQAFTKIIEEQAMVLRKKHDFLSSKEKDS